MSPIQISQIKFNDRLAQAMFILSLVFLTLIAALIVAWVYIPQVEWLAAEAASGDEVSNSASSRSFVERNAVVIGGYLFYGLLLIWPVFWGELFYNLRTDGSFKSFWRERKFDLLACICPPLRLAAPSHREGGRIWLPRLGWQQPGKALVKRLERSFGSPMLTIALLILPVLLIEFGLKDIVAAHFWLRLTLHVCTGFIWCAFSFEFIVMISATDRKLAYVKKNWIDLAIVLLPAISFLRSIRAFQLAKFAKVQQLARVGRIYRMRGLMMKAIRALMLFEFLNRLLRVTPEKKLAKLVTQRDERADELKELEQEIQAMQEKIRSTKASIQPELGGQTAESVDVKAA